MIVCGLVPVSGYMGCSGCMELLGVSLFLGLRGAVGAA